MKKIFTLLAFTLFLAVGCSEENATDYNDEASAGSLDPVAARSSVWNGVIGVDDNGTFKITADVALLKADLESTLRSEGYNTSIQTLNIVRKNATNNPADIGYMIVGSDASRTSIGVWLVKQNNQFTQDSGFSNSTTCTGCASGCNLSYLTIDGKKIAYCNENGCDYDCTKSESTF